MEMRTRYCPSSVLEDFTMFAAPFSPYLCLLRLLLRSTLSYDRPCLGKQQKVSKLVVEGEKSCWNYPLEHDGADPFDAESNYRPSR